MADWLEELRQEKEKAIQRARREDSGGSLLSPEEKLKSDQSAIERSVQAVAIEPSLQQFTDEVLRDHPLFVNPALMRAVVSRSAAGQSVQEQKEPAPLTGPLQGNFLPAHLDLGNGRYIYRVEWRLHLNYRYHNSAQLQLNEILIAASPHGVQINNLPLSDPSADGFQKTLVNTFREATTALQTPGVRRRQRRRRRWYNRLWNSVFPANRPTRLYAALIVGSMLLLVLIISLVAAYSSAFALD